ncbi:hypothetical protein AMTRI_Chr01g128370 [Amborella trichopoda]|uniref:MADS-box domain-containing protein n=1 Tax=Amborella trichopoda TaxID=13333 RepID=W1NT98_AMBTC|nr:agamous-like MADS-box protein AGL80 [Amborella trichopoda]ERM98250.1 hypothetical protein AMTR_s00095p00172370 [Amborella trichopoda]|eukprot:XP_006832972.1 agamous-like MADS-box protein AGL80 [Amborella trichopoda]
MARKKVTLAWIANDSARKSSFKKRKRGLLKKIAELSTLCGVPAFAVVYGPGDHTPDVWSSDSKAQTVLHRFKSLPETDRNKKTMDHDGFLRQRIQKLRDQIQRQRRENREAAAASLLNEGLAGKGIQSTAVDELNELSRLIERRSAAVRERIAVLRSEEAMAKERISAVGQVMPEMDDHKWFLDEMLGIGGGQLGDILGGQSAYFQDNSWANMESAALYGDYYAMMRS